MGKTFGSICLEAFEINPSDFGRTVMDLLQRDFGLADLEDSLHAPLQGQRQMASAGRP
jgi:hypothetical protein